jgi:Domain of unknown function (DUF6798)
LLVSLSDVRSAHAAQAPSDVITPRRHSPALALGQMLLMLVLILGALYAHHLSSNDQDILPSARHFWNRDWIPHDWYLSLDIPYRYLVDFIVGPLAAAFDFDRAALLSRLTVYCLLVPATYFLFRSLGLRLALMLLILYVFLPHQSLVAGEWIFGGAEAKSFAYGFVLLSTAAFVSERFLLGFAFAGAAMSFHVLVGLYALFCAAGAMLLNFDVYWPQRRAILSRAWILPVTGAFGLYVVSVQLRAKAGAAAAKAAEIYVRFRVPHHVFPGAWGGRVKIVEMLAAIGLFALIFLYGRSRASRFIAAYALCSVVLFGIGLAIYFAGAIPLLKYYWFRFPDVMIPLLGWVLLGMILNEIADAREPFRNLPRVRAPLDSATLRVALPRLFMAAAAVVVVASLVHLLPAREQPEQQASAADESSSGGEDFADDKVRLQPMYEWIAHNTPRDSAFLVDPMRSDFYMWAERAMFVSFRHSPQTESDIAQWYERITLCNGGRPPKLRSEITPHFYDLDQTAIRQIAGRYGLNYYLGRTRQPLTLPRVYSVNGFTLYKID